MPYSMRRDDYANMFGPTTGDRIRLADTELFIEIEHDATIPGDEVKFGGGKVIRDGPTVDVLRDMMPPAPPAAAGTKARPPEGMVTTRIGAGSGS